jgi:ribonuclease HI
MSKATKVSKEISSQLLRCELELLTPEIRRNRRSVSALLAPDFQEIGASGRVWSLNEILDLLETEEFSPLVMENFACRLIDKNVVLVTFRTVRTHPHGGEQIFALRSSIWTKISGKWKLRFHQGTRSV